VQNKCVDENFFPPSENRSVSLVFLAVAIHIFTKDRNSSRTSDLWFEYENARVIRMRVRDGPILMSGYGIGNWRWFRIGCSFNQSPTMAVHRETIFGGMASQRGGGSPLRCHHRAGETINFPLPTPEITRYEVGKY